MGGLVRLPSISAKLAARRAERAKVLRAMKADEELNGRPYGILASLMMYLGLPLTMVTLIGTPLIPGLDLGPYELLVAFSPAITAMISGILGPRLIFLHRLKKGEIRAISKNGSQESTDLGELQAELLESKAAS